MKRLFTVFILFSLVLANFNLSSQKIITIEPEDPFSQGGGQLLLFALGINVTLENSVDIYRVTYTATGSDMMPDTASGLLMLPDDIQGSIPLLVYQHGTTDGRDDVPSELAGAYQLGALFAAKNMAVIAPDLLGMGTSRGFHPYVHAETEATAAVEMMDAVLAWMTENDISWNEQLFLTGYSQGGHSAMALHQYIEEVIPERYEVTASLPMSGPYSISGVMKNIVFTDEPYNFPAYLVYSTRAIKEIYPSLYNHESEMFREPFLPAIEDFVSTGNGLFDLNPSIVATLIQETGTFIPKQIFKDSILNLLENEEDYLFNVALRESDVFDWAPKAPVLMLYCPTDDQVPFENSIIADSVMNLRGALNTRAEDVSGGRNLDHGDCIVPALNTGVPWLFGFVDSTTPTIPVVNLDMRIYPNPTSDLLFIESPSKIESVALYSIDGSTLYSRAFDAQFAEVDIESLPGGVYAAYIYTSEGITIEKIVIQ